VTALPTWAVYRVRGAKAALLGHVDAATEADALRKAAAEFELTEQDMRRVYVRPWP
jgi:hypothetical protein